MWDGILTHRKVIDGTLLAPSPDHKLSVLWYLSLLGAFGDGLDAAMVD